MSKLGSLYIKLVQPEGELSGCTCEVGDWAADEIKRLLERIDLEDVQLSNLRDLVSWAYTKLRPFTFSNVEDALMLDMMKMGLDEFAELDG